MKLLKTFTSPVFLPLSLKVLNKVDSVLVLDNTNYFSTSILLKQSLKFVLCVGFLLLQNVKRIIYSIKRFKLILKLQLKLSFEKLMLNTTKTPIAVPNINIQHRYDFPFLILPVRKKQYFIIARPTTYYSITDYKGCLKNND